MLDPSVLDPKKLNALKFWGLIEDNGGKLRLTEVGRRLSKDKCARMATALEECVSGVAPYAAVIERAVHKGEFTVTATEVAAHWHQHFKAESSDSDRILNDQAVCFFQIAQASGLGKIIIGRKGQATRFEFDADAANQFVERGGLRGSTEGNGAAGTSEDANEDEPAAAPRTAALSNPEARNEHGNRVFITHGKNKKILAQVKELVSFGKFEPIVAQERETAAKPVPDKVMDEMRGCQAAVIHVGADGVLYDEDEKEIPQINGNVLIEIGAAMALYGKNFILLVEEGVKLPSNLQGLYECRYKGDELNMEATMKLLKAFNAFR